MKRFQELLMKDLGWKLLSVAIAATMWFMVINIKQPVDTRTYTRPIAIEHMDVLTKRGLTVGNEEALHNTKIAVKVKAQRTALDRLSQSPEWITPTVDLSELAYAVNGDSVVLPVNVSMQDGISGYDIVSKSPAVVEVRVETLREKKFPVEIAWVGEAPDKSNLSEPKLSSETVIVSGPASVVKKVSAVHALVKADEIGKADAIWAKLQAVDSHGNVIHGVKTDVEEIIVSYQRYEMKQIPIRADITGTPAPGYRAGNVVCTPSFIEVVGSKETLDELDALNLESIDVSGRTIGLTKVFSLKDYLPDDISLKGNHDSVQVTVEIDTQSSRSFNLSSSQISIYGQEDGKDYSIPDGIRLTLSGDDDILDELSEGSIKGSINVSGMTDGTHRAMVHTDLPNGVFSNTVYIEVTVNSEDDDTDSE